MESHCKNKLPLAKFGMVPKHSFLQEINSCTVSTIPDKFYDKVEEGSIILKKAPSFSFCKEGINVDGEDQTLETDLVILATGFKGDKKLKDIFMSAMFQECLVGSPTTAIPLYRECIHPQIPQLAVIGFSESLSNLYTSEIRSRWLAELLDGTFKTPSIKEMEEMWKNGINIRNDIQGPITRDHALLLFIYGTMINSAKTWDGTQREREDSLLNCLSHMDPWIMFRLSEVAVGGFDVFSVSVWKTSCHVISDSVTVWRVAKAISDSVLKSLSMLVIYEHENCRSRRWRRVIIMNNNRNNMQKQDHAYIILVSLTGGPANCFFSCF
ncbi:hypothetical protein GH714_035383 [Hevea brasiliensis]|uniref:Flavin-containing monooxygenase n=1 Tax=Hevea brasiliensis TaxID=3981 RepID=A0A6A6LQ44_HEVBR|nr:hypothetical protein GH714_035383 [Hevea brasiliensis]